MERVGIRRFYGERPLVARQCFILPADLLLKNAEVEPGVRKVRVARERLPVGDFGVPLAPELVENVAEIERNDRIVPVEPRGEIVEPLRQLQVAFLLVFFRAGEDLLGVGVSGPRVAKGRASPNSKASSLISRRRRKIARSVALSNVPPGSMRDTGLILSTLQGSTGRVQAA